MQTPIVNETSVRRSIADADDFGIEIAPASSSIEPTREAPAALAWEATAVAPRRSMA